MNLFFLNVGRRCELVNRFREALSEIGGGTIWGSDIDPRAPALQLVDEARIFPHGDSEVFPRHLCAFCQRNDIDLVIPTIDPDLKRLDDMRERFVEEATGSLLLAPSKTVQSAADKRASKARFEEAGLRVAETYDGVPPEAEFPVFVKPPGGSAGAGARTVANASQLEGLLRERADLIVEEFLDGSEYTVDVLCDRDGNPLIALPRKRVKVRGGEAQMSLLERNERLEQHAMDSAEAFGATGPVTIQFIRTADETFVPIELNARMGGGLPLSITSGADWPGWILAMVQGRPFNVDVPITDQLLMTRYDQSFFLTPEDLDSFDGRHP